MSLSIDPLALFFFKFSICAYQNHVTIIFTVVIFSPFLFYFVKNITKHYAWHIKGVDFISVEQMDIFPCSLISALAVTQQEVM